jgi:hypothetical protein
MTHATAVGERGAQRWWVGHNGRVLFELRLQEGLRDGSIRVAFRRWRRPQAVGGRRYRSPIGLIQVDRVATVDGEIPLADAHAAGYPSVEAIMADLKGPPDATTYRLELHRIDAADPRDELAQNAELTEADLDHLQRALARLDRERAWTTATLRAIEQHPATRAADLAKMLAWPELHVFKTHVRKLKALGLTISLEVGYRLAPRGQAYLRTLDWARG